MVSFLAAIAGLAGISGVELARFVKKHLKTLEEKNKSERRQKRVDIIQKAIGEGKHLDALEMLYPLADIQGAGLSRLCVKVNDTRMPVGLVSCNDWSPGKLEINLRDNQTYGVDAPETHLGVLDKDIVAQSQAEIEFFGLKVWNAPVYRLLNVEIQKSKLRATFCVDQFFRHTYELGSLWGELTQGLIDAEGDISKLSDGRNDFLPRRVKLLDNAQRVANYAARMCPGGIQTTVAIRRQKENDFVIPVERRSQTVAGGQGLVSVLPHAFHQPMNFPGDEAGIHTTFYREFFEELLGGEEAGQKGRRLRHDWYIDESEAAAWFHKSESDYVLLLTGLSFDLVSGNYEASLLCVINDPTFWTRYSHLLKTNWEFSDDMLPLLSTKQAHLMEKALTRRDWVGSGLYSIARGLVYLQRMEPSRVELPDIATLSE